MSGAPTRSRTSPNSRSRSSVLDRSAWTAIAVPPEPLISSSVCRREPWYFGSGSMVRAVSATVAPSAASRWAIALPRPRLVPVTSATLPSQDTGNPRKLVGEFRLRRFPQPKEVLRREHVGCRLVIAEQQAGQCHLVHLGRPVGQSENERLDQI